MASAPTSHSNSVCPSAADFETMSGIPLEPVYGPEDGGDWPGVFPYTRGPYASMHRSKLWTMRMFAGFGTAEDTNGRFRDILEAGGDGLSVAFDLPTLMGRDSDDPHSAGEVGKCGVAVDNLAVAAGQNRNFETKFPDATAHAIHGGIVLSGISSVKD